MPALYVQVKAVPCVVSQDRRTTIIEVGRVMKCHIKSRPCLSCAISPDRIVMHGWLSVLFTPALKRGAAFLQHGGLVVASIGDDVIKAAHAVTSRSHVTTPGTLTSTDVTTNATPASANRTTRAFASPPGLVSAS